MIFIANKTREFEKKNNNLNAEIVKILEDIKINKIELITYQNSSYLTKMYSLYFSEVNKNVIPKVVSINKFSKKDQNIKLVKTGN